MISQLYLVGCLIYILIPSWYVHDEQLKFVYAFKLLFIAQGIYMPLLRASEPFFFGVLWQNIKDLVSYLCCRRKILEKELDQVEVDGELLEAELERTSKEYQQIRISNLAVNQENGTALNASSLLNSQQDMARTSSEQYD